MSMKLYGNITYGLAVVLILLTQSSCKKEQVRVQSQNQKILFQYDYSNAAWGVQHYGFFIDNEGRVVKYENPEDWNDYDKDYVLSEEDVAENIRRCVDTGERISPDELQKYSGYIRNIALTKVSAKRNVAKDAGKIEYICYLYSKTSGSYKGSLIRMEGDYTCENLNYYSRKVSDWLKDVSEKITAK